MPTAQILHDMKQIIIINQAFKLTEEKQTVWVVRASAGAFFEAGKDARKTWIREGRPKTVLNAFDEKDLQDLLSKAERRRLPHYVVAYNTESITNALACLGIGPACNTQVDELMGVLNFYRWIRENAVSARVPTSSNG